MKTHFGRKVIDRLATSYLERQNVADWKGESWDSMFWRTSIVKGLATDGSHSISRQFPAKTNACNKQVVSSARHVPQKR